MNSHRKTAIIVGVLYIISTVTVVLIALATLVIRFVVRRVRRLVNNS